MSFGGGPGGFQAIKALVDSHADFRSVADKDWAAAAGLIVKKLLIAAGQSAQSLNALREAVGDDIFESQLKSLSHHQAKLLAKRLDKSVPDLEVSTARAATAWIRAVLAPAPEGPARSPETAKQDETAASDPATDEPEAKTETLPDDSPPSPPANPNPYFGRKSFRTG